MNSELIEKLNTLNQDFYNKVGNIWNTKPDYIWEGWQTMIQHINLPKASNILDIGCGSARFANFISQHAKITNYTGIDFSKELLGTAQINDTNIDQINLIQSDILSKQSWQNPTLQKTKFDLIVCFGLLHHIPSYTQRLQILSQATQTMTENGYLVFTSWQFLDVPRLAKRIVNPLLVTSLNSNDITNFESGDYILNWVKKVLAYRYAHYISQDEIKKLANDSGLKIISQFESDGKTENQNRYVICRPTKKNI